MIQDGEGFILIKKGKPLVHYFRAWDHRLKGHLPLDYFNSHPVIEFNLCRVPPEELAWALKLCNIEDHDRVVPQEPAVPGSVSRELSPPARTAVPPVAKPFQDKRIPEPVVVSPPVPTVNKGRLFLERCRWEHTPSSRQSNPPHANLPGTKKSQTRLWFHHRFIRLKNEWQQDR